MIREYHQLWMQAKEENVFNLKKLHEQNMYILFVIVSVKVVLNGQFDA